MLFLLLTLLLPDIPLVLLVPVGTQLLLRLADSSVYLTSLKNSLLASILYLLLIINASMNCATANSVAACLKERTCSTIISCYIYSSDFMAVLASSSRVASTSLSLYSARAAITRPNDSSLLYNSWLYSLVLMACRCSRISMKSRECGETSCLNSSKLSYFYKQKRKVSQSSMVISHLASVFCKNSKIDLAVIILLYTNSLLSEILFGSPCLFVYYPLDPETIAKALSIV